MLGIPSGAWSVGVVVVVVGELAGVDVVVVGVGAFLGVHDVSMPFCTFGGRVV